MNEYILPDRFENDLQQKTVIQLDFGRNLVLAPAGCGKTELLTERIARALALGIVPEEMANLTFTNRASREMVGRVEKRIGKDLSSSLFIGNLHRFCIRTLMQYRVVPNHTHIIDEEESLDILEQLAPEKRKTIKDFSNKVLQIDHLLSQYRSNHPNDVILNKNKICFGMLKKMCLELRHQYRRSEILWIADHIDEQLNSEIASKETMETAVILKTAYEFSLYKDAHFLMDYDDILIRSYTFLDNNPEAFCKKKWLQVDEVQDLNTLQLSIIDKIADKDATILYLGDKQQAIFSFLGADGDTIKKLEEVCGTTYRLGTNYRSAKYLTDMHNAYARMQLNVPLGELSVSTNDSVKETEALSIRTAELYESDGSGSIDQYTLAFQTAISFPDNGEKTAIIVPTNKAADKISEIFKRNGEPHFKLSGIDVFSTPELKLLKAHLHAVYDDSDFLSGARLIWKLASQSSYKVARNGMDTLKRIGMLPTDLFCFVGSTYMLEFLDSYERDSVVFDTEATGLDVWEDDIMQIAALKINKGQIVGRFNVFLEGDASRIPQMLKDKPNPLYTLYRGMKHTPRRQALEDFLSFVGDAPLIGHNVEYDFRLLDQNIRRECGRNDFSSKHSIYFDTLKLARLLLPGEKSYKLDDLIKSYSLEGVNTHLADDDAMATVSLVGLLQTKAADKVNKQKDYLARIPVICSNFRRRYLASYLRAKYSMYETPTNPSEPALVTELKAAYADFRALGIIGECDKFEHICDYLSNEMLAGECGMPLKKQLDQHLRDLDTLKEVDLCSSNTIKEKCLISTVHKAKGLGFENVIVTDVTDQTYPASWNRNRAEAIAEDSRKFYVAITRAKKRLCLIRYNRLCSRGRYIKANDSPFLKSILPFFIEV